MSNTVPACSIRSLVHSYGGGVALDIPSFDIAPGEICLLSGPNGSGKTTLLMILALLLKPSSGSVRLFGTEVAQNRDYRQRRKITLVHQKPVLFSTTVRENLEYGLRAVGISSKDIRERVDRILDQANLRDIAGKYSRKLSGGEAQRVVLGRALVLQTPVLLLDEPTNSLDDASRPLLYGLLREAHARGTTIVIAAHDPGIAAALHSRVLRMEKGRIDAGPEIAV